MVEWKTLGEIADIRNGYTPSTKNPDFWDEGNIPWFTLEDIRKSGRILNDSIKHITPLGLKRGGLFSKKSLIISTTATIGEYALVLSDFICNQQISCISLKDKYNCFIDIKYLYYLGNQIGEWCKKNVNGGGGLAIVGTNKLREFLIPIPSKPEQERIVKILDTFTDSIANLKAQIDARRKQYEYYRDQLLDLEGKEEVEWKKIEDLGKYFGGLTGKTKKDFEDGNAHFITYMNVFSNPSLDVSSVGSVHINEGEKQNKIQKGDILFTGSSETPDESGMSCVVTKDLNEDYYMNSFCFGLRLNNYEEYDLNYFKHVFRSYAIRQEISKTASGVTRFNISKARFSKIQIPIPSKEEQSRIVGILDQFEAIIANLEAQLKAREKQYEYYRNKLLTFD